MNNLLSQTINVSKSSFIILIVVCSLLAISTIFCWIILFSSKIRNNFFAFFRKLKNFDNVVETVYTDKTKNYSGTEFFPIPAKAPTEDSTYTFLGWNKFAKNKDGEYETKPIFMRKIKTCIVNVYDDKDNLLEKHEVEYGSGIKLIHKLVLRESTKEFEYEFAGWDKDTKAFFENTEIHPMFKAKPIKYNYKFILDDGKTIVYEKNAIYGTPIACPADPVKIDKNYLYEFVGWKGYKRNMVLTENSVFIAEFNKIEIDNKEVEKKRNDAIEVAVNDFKQSKQENKKDKLVKQENQKYKSINNIEIKLNDKKGKLNNEKKEKNLEDKESHNKLFNGIIIEKNSKKKA